MHKGADDMSFLQAWDFAAHMGQQGTPVLGHHGLLSRAHFKVRR